MPGNIRWHHNALNESGRLENINRMRDIHLAFLNCSFIHIVIWPILSISRNRKGTQQWKNIQRETFSPVPLNGNCREMLEYAASIFMKKSLVAGIQYWFCLTAASIFSNVCISVGLKVFFN